MNKPEKIELLLGAYKVEVLVDRDDLIAMDEGQLCDRSLRPALSVLLRGAVPERLERQKAEIDRMRSSSADAQR